MQKAISKLIVPFLIVFLIGVAAPNAQAQLRPNRGRAAASPALRVKSKRVIRRTAVVLMAAHTNLKAGKVYTGNFARAVKHQRYARFLWKRGFFLRAIHQSRRARILALAVINANKGPIKAEYNFDKDESSLMKNAPSDTALDDEMSNDKDFQSAYPAQGVKDEDFLGEIGDIDLTDLD